MRRLLGDNRALISRVTINYGINNEEEEQGEELDEED